MADDWIGAVAAELARLDGQRHARKMKATILALVQARLAGVPEETVWEKPDTCARSVYQHKWKKREPFASVLAAVHQAALTFKETEAARLLAQRAAEEAEAERKATEAKQRAERNVKLASPAAITRLVEMLGDPDPAVRFKAAQEIAKLAGVGKGEDAENEQAGWNQNIHIYIPDNGRDRDQAAGGAAGGVSTLTG